MKTASAQTNTYVRVTLHFLDWIPIIGTGKNVTEIFIQKYWKAEPSKLSPTQRTYYDHINEKSVARSLLLAIPVLGNIIAIFRDVNIVQVKFQAEVEKSELNILIHGAEQGSGDAVAKLMSGTPAQKDQAIEACFKASLGKAYCNSRTARNALTEVLRTGQDAEKHKVETWLINNLRQISLADSSGGRMSLTYLADLCQKDWAPLSLKHKFIELAISADLAGTEVLADHYISRLLGQSDNHTKTFTLNLYQRSAEEGSVAAWSRLESYGRYSLDADIKTALFIWMFKTAENFSSALNSKAWLFLQEHCSLGTRERSDEIVQFYITVAGKQGIPADRATFLDERFSVISILGTPEQKNKILLYYVKLAEAGNLEKMHLAAGMYFRTDRATGLRWYERAGNANYLPSIIFLGNYYYLSDDERSAFWYEKAASRDPVAAQRLNTIRTRQRNAQDSGRRREEAERARADYERAQQQQREQEQERLRRERAQENARARARAQAQNNGRNVLITELKNHIGNYSSQETLRTLFKKWCLRNHPDKGGSTTVFQHVLGLYQMFMGEYN